MSTYVSNRNSDGKTDENGHFRLPLKIMEGQIFEGLELSASSTPDMKVHISSGEAKIPYQDYAYAVWSDDDSEVTISTATSNPRIDRIVAYVDRSMTFSSSSVNNPGCLKFMAVAGNPTTSPVPRTDAQVQSSVGAGNPWIELGRVNVPANASQIVTSNITADGRVYMKMSGNIQLPEITTTDGSTIKFAVVSEGQPLPSAIPGSTLIVLVTKN